jgi:hypothetical protein
MAEDNANGARGKRGRGWVPITGELVRCIRTLPDGEILQGREIEHALSQLLERSIRLERADAPALGRIGATGAHHDAAPIHLLTTSTLAHLRAIAPTSDWDVRRFRPNLLLDDGTTPTAFAEDALVGGTLRGRSGLKLTVAGASAAPVTRTRPQSQTKQPRRLRALLLFVRSRRLPNRCERLARRPR